MKNKQKLFKRIKLIIVCYCLVGTGLYYAQDKLLFHPQALPADHTWRFTQPFTETFIDIDTDNRINLVQFAATGTSAGPDTAKPKGVVLYFHGNKENIQHYQAYSQAFTKNGYEVWMPDYPGYGKSTGEFSEKQLYAIAMQVYKLARTKFPPHQIVIFGKSLGTGIAAQLASVRDCRNLVLETPYYSLTSLLRLVAWMYPVQTLSHFKLPTNEYLPKVTAPITIFHGTADWTIPYFNARRLQKTLKPQDRFITIQGGTHNNLFSFPLVRQTIDSLLAH